MFNLFPQAWPGWSGGATKESRHMPINAKYWKNGEESNPNLGSASQLNHSRASQCGTMGDGPELWGHTAGVHMVRSLPPLPSGSRGPLGAMVLGHATFCCCEPLGQ